MTTHPPAGPGGTHPPKGGPGRFLLAARDYFEGAVTALMVFVTVCAVIGVTAWVWGQS